jgi:choline dehydrogenase-like flavoprotein
MFAMSNPWLSARDYRDTMLRAAQIATFIVLTRDKGEGKITLDPHSEPVIHYTPSAFDRRHILHGMRQAARIHIAAGATEVISLQNKRTQLQRTTNTPISEQTWRNFDRQLARHGLGTNHIIMYSAHQMGTCRIGTDPAQSVLDQHSQVHGVTGLFVCDASVFPAASGVNPMLSIMALAHASSQYIKTTL